MTERHYHEHQRKLCPKSSVEPAHSSFGGDDVTRERKRRPFDVVTEKQRERAPDQQKDDHHSRDLHNAQSLAARLVNTFGITPPEISGDRDTEYCCKVVRIDMQRLSGHFTHLVEQMSQILSGADGA